MRCPEHVLLADAFLSRVTSVYLDPEVGVQQELELKALLSLVAHGDDSLQCVLAQCDAVYQTEVHWPCLAVLLTDAIAVEAEVELDGASVERIFGRRLAQVLPARVACEAVLGELGASSSRRRWAEVLECVQ